MFLILMNVLVMISYIHIYVCLYEMCLTNDFMRSASPNPVHRRVRLGSMTRVKFKIKADSVVL